MKAKPYSILRKSSKSMNTQPKTYDLRRELCSAL